MFDWIRREWEELKELARDESCIDASWMLDEGWEKWIINPPLLNGSPIEIRGVGWTKSVIVICGEPLDEDADLDQTLHWRRTGIYRVQEEKEFARAVADRLMGRHRLIAVDSSASGISTGWMQANTQQAMLGGQPSNSGFLSSLLGGGGSGPYGLG